MVTIADYDVYTNGMRKSMLDKIWFLDMIDGVRHIVDYGCADGSLIGFMKEEALREFGFTGLDIDSEMLGRARSKYPDVLFSVPEAFESLGIVVDGACLNCSSVIHEVYSYGDAESIHAFWNFVFHSGFRYIAIRDMAVSREEMRKPFWEYLEFMEGIRKNKKIDERFMDFLRVNQIPFTSFGKRDMVHFLLKYRYEANWEREVRENYLPLYAEEILDLVPRELYRVRHFEHYTLPHLKVKIRDDLGFELNAGTHYKLLLERI